jgi:osmotically-inducible protein OsmY
MRSTHIALRWGSPVVDGLGRTGKIRGAFLAPRTGKVTHILVRRGLFGSTEPAALDGAQQSEDGPLMLRENAVDSTPARGSVRLTANTPVRAGGATTSLRGLVLDGEARATRYVLVKHDRDTKAVPHDLVQNLTSGSPSVKLEEAEVDALPVYRSDRDALSNAAGVLDAADPTDGRTYGSIQLSVVDGVAQMNGNVRLPLERQAAEEAVRSAKGVLDVHNAAVADSDLCIDIAEALAREGITRDAVVVVKSVMGRVSLKGYVASQQLADTASTVAGGVNSVRSVESQLQVQGPPTDGPTPDAPAQEETAQV